MTDLCHEMTTKRPGGALRSGAVARLQSYLTALEEHALAPFGSWISGRMSGSESPRMVSHSAFFWIEL